MEMRPNISQATAAFAALSQEPRLTAFRHVIAAGDKGLTAGEIAANLGAPASTTSGILAQLVRARLLQAERQGRSIRYSADAGGISALTTFLLRDCCNNQPELCAPTSQTQSTP